MDAIKRCPRAVVAAAIVGMCLLLSGFGPKNVRIHPEATARSAEIKTVVLVAPEIKVFELSTGDTTELRDEWSAQGKDNVTKALQMRFSEKSIKISDLKAESAEDPDFKEIMALFEVVSASIIRHTYNEGANPNFFADKMQNFDYSLGPLDKVLSPSGGDAILLVYGVDHISTAGKKALNVLGAVTGIAVGAFNGVMLLPRMQGTSIRMALIDRNGSILWYNINSGMFDLRDSASSTELVNKTLEDFPGLGR